jgi:hypothetical protein
MLISHQDNIHSDKNCASQRRCEFPNLIMTLDQNIFPHLKDYSPGDQVCEREGNLPRGVLSTAIQENSLV